MVSMPTDSWFERGLSISILPDPSEVRAGYKELTRGKVKVSLAIVSFGNRGHQRPSQVPD